MIESATAASSATSQQNLNLKEKADRLGDLDASDFLGLMIAELQNQDPLSPKENSEIMQQISQIRAIEASAEETAASRKLTQTLDAVLRGQNLSNASSLIGKIIDASVSEKTENGVEVKQITGEVSSVSIEDNQPILHVKEESSEVEHLIGIDQLRGISGVTQ